MGKPTGFLEYDERDKHGDVTAKSRIKNFNEFHTPLPLGRTASSRAAAAWTAAFPSVSPA